MIHEMFGIPGPRGCFWLSGLAALSIVLLCRMPIVSGEIVRGDINADGAVDVSDAVRLLTFLRGGEPLPCLEAAEINRDGRGPDGSDAVCLLNALTWGGGCVDLPPLDPGVCAGMETVEPPRLADFTLGFEVEPQEGYYRVFATLTTANNTVGAGAQGWSFSIAAEKVDIVSATTAGTVATWTGADPPGLVDEGFVICEVVDPDLVVGDGPQGQGAVSAVLLSLREDITLPPDGTVRIAKLHVEPQFSPILDVGRLVYRDGMKLAGRPVRNVVTIADTSQVPDR
ncbi:MAG: dockerin type I repeat-containing protein, partial [Planctomycetes bacterium]|nr:dockerin type I repeat-containing protein [Planctomycetota bacterium]